MSVIVAIAPNARQKLSQEQNLKCSVELDHAGNLVVNFYEWLPDFWFLTKSVPFPGNETTEE